MKLLIGCVRSCENVECHDRCSMPVVSLRPAPAPAPAPGHAGQWLARAIGLSSFVHPEPKWFEYISGHTRSFFPYTSEKGGSLIEYRKGRHVHPMTGVGERSLALGVGPHGRHPKNVSQKGPIVVGT